MSNIHPDASKASLWRALSRADEISMDVTDPKNVRILLHDDVVPQMPEVLASNIKGVELAQLFINAIDAFRESEQPVCRWYVSIYEYDRAYGGPEEGGWYYECGQPMTDFQLSFEDKENAILYGAFLDEKILPGMNEGRPPIGSVLSRGRYSVVIETEPPKAYPDHKPRYE